MQCTHVNFKHHTHAQYPLVLWQECVFDLLDDLWGKHCLSPADLSETLHKGKDQQLGQHHVQCPLRMCQNVFEQHTQCSSPCCSQACRSA